jgi:hypothetical protein
LSLAKIETEEAMQEINFRSTQARFGGRVASFVIWKTSISFTWKRSEPVKNVFPSSPVSLV